MESTNNSLAKAFSKNRAEELSSDVWKNFVIPLFFPKLDLLDARKPRMIIGGRGCGKTMILRYFSHETQFSQNRSPIPETAINNIGLYWRIDTQFANAMKGRGVSEEDWSNAFNHFLCVIIAIEVLNSIKTVSNSKHPAAAHDMCDKIAFEKTSLFGVNLGTGIDHALHQLDKSLIEFELWVSNVGKRAEPIFFPGVSFINALISDIKNGCPKFNDTVFHVFIDEFENLLEYQQRIINTRLKHSESPLIFSVAMKKRGEISRETVGAESISDIADFRPHDLEDYLLSSDFELFSAEVLCLHLAEAGVKNLPTTSNKLTDVEHFDERVGSKEYREKMISYARTVLPGLGSRDLAKNVFTESRLTNKLNRTLDKALRDRGSKLKSGDFISPEAPQESITNVALLHRPALAPDVILHEFNLAREGKSTRFKDWIHNNFIGCLLWLYDSDQKVCPFFSGFDVFCSLSHGNLRHLLELCHRALSEDTVVHGNETPTVEMDLQARAARQTSISLIREVRSFGKMGNRLHAFVLRIGSLFALAHRRNSQSEPEQNHFSIKGGNSALSPDDERLIAEAVKWSVLFEEEETKKKEKSESHQANYEYVLNPIYSPYFNISYRKKRKLEITVEEFRTISNGTYTEVKQLLGLYAKKWTVELEDSSPTLFSHLIIEGE